MRRWRWVRRLALFLYPHAVTGLLSSSSRHVDRRNAVVLPAYSFALGLIALLGFMAVAAGVKAMPQYARRLQGLRQQFRGAGAVPADRSRPGSSASRSPPSPSARWCRRRSCRSPAPISSPATSTSEYIDPELQPATRVPGRQDRLAGGQARRAVLHHRAADAIRDPAAAAGRHLDHPDAAARDFRALHRRLHPWALADRLGGGHRQRAPGWRRRSAFKTSTLSRCTSLRHDRAVLRGASRR